MEFKELNDRIDGILVKISGGAFEDDKEEVLSWKEELKNAFLITGIKDNEGIKLIIKRFASELEDINLLLLNVSSEKLPDIKRDVLLEKKKMYKDFISIFPEAEQTIEAIEKSIEENEKHLNLR